jgi:hypothetical protein
LEGKAFQGDALSIGDKVLVGPADLPSSLTAALILGEIAYQVITGAQPAISKFGLGSSATRRGRRLWGISAPARCSTGRR